MIANAAGRCEFRTYDNGKEVRESEYYLWNVEPNPKQGSSAFIHKLIAQLYRNNEALIFPAKYKGKEYLYVADGFETKEDSDPTKPNAYVNVTLDGIETQKKAFRQDEVIHITLNAKKIKPVLDGIYSSYNKLIEAAQKAYRQENGSRWKVRIGQMAAGADNFQTTYETIMNNYVKPFANADSAVLPEYEGYTFEDISGKSGSRTSTTTRDIRAMIDDIFDFTAKAFQIPTVLLGGQVEGTQDAMNRWLTLCIDPLMENIQERIVRAKYSYEQWREDTTLRIDTSSLIHFDLFANAANIEKLIGSGYSFNDIRKASGQEPIKEAWADDHFITKNFAEAGSVGTTGGGE